MSEQFSTDTARIRALKTSMVSLLEHEDEETVAASALTQGAKLLMEAYQPMLNLGSQQLLRGSLDRFQETLQAVQSAYADWRDVDAAFQNTLHLAYNGYIARQNLLLDSVHAELNRRIGDPVAALYSRLHGLWQEHLQTAPWDEFMAQNVRDANTAGLNANLKALVHGDHLDVEDAIETLTGPLRYAFANYLEARTDSLDLLEDSMWMRPEIVVMNDYWRANPRIRLIDILSRKATKHASAFARVQDFFANGHADTSHLQSRWVAEQINGMRPEQRETYLRCLLLHPNQEVRRFAASNVDIEVFWKLVTPSTVPCATILSMLERIVGSKQYDENLHKVFFQTMHRRLLNLTSRSDVIYARGIVRILVQLPFFMEDSYFERLMTVVGYLGAKERQYKIGDGMLAEWTAELKREKHKIGTLQAEAPNLTSIPPVVLRKLARDGHYWYELSMHPMFKIARETIPHVNTEERALRAANNHMINQDVIRSIGRNRALFTTLPAKLALLANPRTPPAVGLGYIMDFTASDCEQLLRRSTVHPELRTHLLKRLNR